MTKPPTTAPRSPVRPERLRSTADGTFAFLPHRFLRDGFFASLRADELRLYLFLVLAADRRGMSFYHYDSICSLLESPLEAYLAARNALIARDLIAFDGSRFQVLSLPDTPVAAPPAPLVTDDDLDEHDPASIRRRLRNALR
jgi:hypothetical protein